MQRVQEVFRGWLEEVELLLIRRDQEGERVRRDVNCVNADAVANLEEELRFAERRDVYRIGVGEWARRLDADGNGESPGQL